MAFKSFRFTGLVGGLYAAANIFDQPQGTLPLLSNLIYTKRGGLQTVDGSHVISSPAAGPGVYAPIAAMAQYNPAGVSGPIPVLFGITLTPAGVATVINLIPLWTGIFAGPYPSAGPVVGAVQFSNSMVFAFGLNVPPYLYDPIANPGMGLVQIANTFQPTTNYPPWLASTAYIATTSKVLGAVGAISYIWQAQNSGVSNDSAPAWTATVGAIVQDGAVRWKNKGAASAEAPLGAAFVFNHLNSLWVWGTAPTYIDTGASAGIDGPDSLRMSDSGNPTSFDPSNQAFIGQGDGQLPQGGATWTQLEVGIPASAQLILFKTKSTYSVIGAFPSITISEIPNGVGCCAGNSIQLVPGIGVMRLSFSGIAVFDGTRDQVDQYTDPLRPYLYQENAGQVGEDIIPVDWTYIANATSTQTVNPPGYLLQVPTIGSNGALTRAFFFDRLLKAWSVIDYPAGMPIAGALFNVATGVPTASLISGYSDGTVRQIFAGDEQWDVDQVNGQLIQWGFGFPAAGSPGTNIYFRRGIIRAAPKGHAANLLAAYVKFQDENGTPDRGPTPLAIDADALTQAVDIDLSVLGGLQLQLYGQGRMLVEGLELHYLPKPTSRIPG